MFDIVHEIRSEEDVASSAPARAPYRRIALLGNALPRKCGLATFTSHVADALRQRYPDMAVDHYAMDDGSGITYPGGIHTIDAGNATAYRDAAKRIEANGADAIWLQHEFGIFGGDSGSLILELLAATDLPLILTLHTVLEYPSDAQDAVLRRLAARASTLTVMAENGAEILRRRYGIDAERIRVVPHGVPDLHFRDPDELKPRFGWQGRTVLMTFGLLAPDKGIRHMIEAMPAVVRARPDALYAIVGATHPNQVHNHGESYREMLAGLASELGVQDHVQFVDKFVEQGELLAMLQASDVYVSPYLNMAQVTSGTLSYAVAAGKPVVATPYLHARELLANDHGLLVPPANPVALADAVVTLLSDDARRHAMARAAYADGRTMLWPRVVERSIAPSAGSSRTQPRSAAVRRPLDLPLTAIARMSDSVGMFQHARFSIPDRDHGYCIDDNARALMVMARRGGKESEGFESDYASFVQHGWNPKIRRFRNFMCHSRQWLEDFGSDDSNGRTIWALGVAAAQSDSVEIRHWARDLFEESASCIAGLESPRSKAFAALGGYALLRRHPSHKLSLALLDDAGRRLMEIHSQAARPDWDWFEPELAYDNARLSEALIRAGQAGQDQDMVERGLSTLGWLVGQQTSPRGRFRPVGSNGFGRSYAAPLAFDQQPLEATATVDAAAAAYEVSGDEKWHGIASTAFGWFFGDNDAGVPIAVLEEGGCFDGLMATGFNRNQGAESILSLHMAALTMKEAFETIKNTGQSGECAAEARTFIASE